MTRSRYAATRPEIPPPTTQYDARAHSECTSATTLGHDARIGRGQHAVAEVEHVARRARRRPRAAVLDDRRAPRAPPPASRPTAPPDRGCPAARVPGATRAAASVSDVRQSTPTTVRRRHGLGHRAEQLGGADPEVGHRHPGAGQRREHPRAVRQHVAAVVGQRQRAGPRVEQLDGVDPGVDLHLQERDGDVGQRRHQRVPGLGLAEHHRLGALVVAARAALDQVGRQRERRAGEADQRHVAQLGDQQRDRLGDRRDLLAAQGVSSPRRRRRCGSGAR